jgi:hypothetical protein
MIERRALCPSLFLFMGNLSKDKYTGGPANGLGCRTVKIEARLPELRNIAF